MRRTFSSVRSLGSPSHHQNAVAATSESTKTPSKFKLGRSLVGRSSEDNGRQKDLEKAVAGMSVRDKDERLDVVYLVSSGCRWIL
jgi:hypothetical protein